VILEIEVATLPGARIDWYILSFSQINAVRKEQGTVSAYTTAGKNEEGILRVTV
jgi:hypothetical protein